MTKKIDHFEVKSCDEKQNDVLLYKTLPCNKIGDYGKLYMRQKKSVPISAYRK